ncbi:MAG: hypothetical protein R6U20_05830 [Longimonas sp.]|uniref:hypothetical protein n=1 Tax=Longimonas sp. TaxID=2039626 RepID=UPI0039754A05
MSPGTQAASNLTCTSKSRTWYNYTHATQDKARQLYQAPTLEGYRHGHAPYTASDLYPLSQIDTDDPRPHTLVVAPTGAGKTNFLLARCQRRVFYTLPFTAMRTASRNFNTVRSLCCWMR